jgi:class 3 adenylate cyclase
VQQEFEQKAAVELGEEGIQEMLLLASRIREQTGKELDEEAILAVAEATGAPSDYVRLAVRSMEPAQKESAYTRLQRSFLSFTPTARRYVSAAALGSASAILFAAGLATRDASGLLVTLSVVAALGAAWSTAISRDLKTGAISGAIYAGVAFLAYALIAFVINPFPFLRDLWTWPGGLPLGMLGGAAAGAMAQMAGKAVRKQMGIEDPAARRYSLLQQMLEIQDKLKAEEQLAAYLSLDVVGSTQIKVREDQMAVEYTMSEYHRHVAMVSGRFGGRIHSTAGDGVICVFPTPQQAFDAGRALLGGWFEFNAMRNRTSAPWEIRAGIHSGKVAAAGGDAGKVEFAHVIDIAAHMQKVADPGTLAVSEPAARAINGGLDAVGAQEVSAQGVTGRVWAPAVRQFSLGSRRQD